MERQRYNEHNPEMCNSRTMNQATTLLVCAVLAAASLPATCENLIDVDLLDYSLLPGNWNAHIQQTAASLLAIGVPAGASPATVKNRVDYLLANGVSNLLRFSVYADLVNLADEDYAPTPELVTRVMEICAIVNDPSFTAREVFNRFLRTFVMPKFGKYKQHTLEQLSVLHVKNLMAENHLDIFFAANLGLNGYDDEAMLGHLESLNLVTGELNVNEAIPVAKNLIAWSASEKGNPFYIFINFIHRSCADLQNNRVFHINVILLAVTFKYPVESFSTKIKKLIEYSRLCASSHRDQTAIVSNIAKRINSEDWPAFKPAIDQLRLQ